MFEAQVAAAKSGTDDAGFQKALALFDGLKPKQVKDLLMGMQVTDAAKYVSAMDADRAGKIIAEFKNGDEKTFIGNVVDQVRGARKARGAGSVYGSGGGRCSSGVGRTRRGSSAGRTVM